ncbi:MAG: tRNA preQ1(34) S-adenosylmethionine ribosyltransferase-isomerase QueA [Pyrinomonadaceae bacterium]
MLIGDFDFELPEAQIAQTPLLKRDSSRLLVVDRTKGSYSDAGFSDLPEYLREGDVLVVNNTRVFPARLFGKSETGANIEIFLIEELEDGLWSVLAKPGRRLSVGKRVDFADGFSAEVIEKDATGRVSVRFSADGDLYDALDRYGRTPLPPYIKRDREAPETDRERYQTHFAKERGAIAAPTAGLHFTPELLARIKDLGIEVCEITLHVGYGTFEPVRVEDLSEHRVAGERFEIGKDVATTVNLAKKDGRRVVAVGTTSTRALESAAVENGTIVPGKGVAGLTIVPGYGFKIVDAMITNFHLPRSSLLVLVSTFGGHSLIMDAYKHAVANGYRFYSYGDAMIVS